MKLFGSIAAISAIAITGALAAVAAPTPAKHGHGIKAEPGIYDPDNTGLVVGQWGNGGVDGGPGVLIAKIEPTGENAAGQVEFKGVNGKTLTKIGFDIRADTYCGAGAPRFNVYTADNPDNPVFFGCSAMTTNATSDPDQFGHVWLTKEVDLGSVEGAKLSNLEIVQDEEDAAIIDNIVVNDTTISKPSKKK
jgi:hypothetical protein